jgi:hypothetical protein
MFPCQGDPDPDEEADHKTDDETKPGRVTHRAFTQIKNPRRFIFVHDEKSALLTVVRKTGEALALPDSLLFPSGKRTAM